MDCSEVPMPFGKHKGWTLGQLPDDYLGWLVSGRCDSVEPGGWAYAAGLRTHIDEEVRRRNEAADDAEDEEAERRRKADFGATWANAPTEQCTRCHDTGYVSGFGMKANCNCERGLLHKVRDLEKVAYEERLKCAMLETELRLERSQTTYWRGRRASDANRAQDKSREADPAVPRIRSSVTRTLCVEIISKCRQSYAKNLHPDARISEDDVQREMTRRRDAQETFLPDKEVRELLRKKRSDRLANINASLDFLEKCADTLRNQ